MARFDNIETISQTQKFGNVPFHFGASTPIGSDLVDGYTWFEPGAIFPQPWTYNMAEGCWLSAPVLIDWGYLQHSMAQFAVQYNYKTIPFYGVTSNRIYFRHLYGTMWNVGSVAHDSTNIFFAYALHRFLGSAVLEVTHNLADYSSGLTVPTFTTSNSLDNRPSSSSMKRITELNINTWIPGNTWWQRLHVARYGNSSSASGTIGISIQQIMQFARL